MPDIKSVLFWKEDCFFVGHLSSFSAVMALFNPSTRNPKITVTLIMQDLKYQMKIHFCKQPALRLDCNFMYVDMHA